MKPFTLADREALLDELVVKLRHLLIEKGKEYAGKSKDTLSNFRDREAFTGRQAKEIVFNDLLKHVDAIKNWAVHDHRLTLEQAENRLTDSLVYIILLIALYRSE